PKRPENHLSLAAASEADLARVEKLCREVLGDLIYGADGVTFAQALGERLASRGETVACAESCTGGLLSELLTEVSGSSRWMQGSYVTYSNAMKESALGVPRELIVQH